MPRTVLSTYSDGPTLTAAAAASLLPTYAPTTVPAGYFQVGRVWRMSLSGRISCVITTPGTARFDLRLAAITVFDTLAIPLNIVAKTNVSWWLDVLLTCRSAGTGTTATLFGQGWWRSEANILTPLPSTGPGPGGTSVPYNTAPVVGAGFDSTIANALDIRFTQTVATGSMTCHQAIIEELTGA